MFYLTLKKNFTLLIIIRESFDEFSCARFTAIHNVSSYGRLNFNYHCSGLQCQVCMYQQVLLIGSETISLVVPLSTVHRPIGL